MGVPSFGLAMDPYGLPRQIVFGATGTGTTASATFSAQTRPLGGPIHLVLQLIPTGTFSAFKVDLQVSLDGGTTWTPVVTAIDLVTSPTTELETLVNPGAIYRLNVSTFTGGTSAVVMGSVS